MILRLCIAILLIVESGMTGMLADQWLIPLLAIAGGLILVIRPIQLDVPLTVKVLVPALLVALFAFRAVALDSLTLERGEFVFPVWVTNSLAECFLLGQLFELIKKRNARDGLLNFCLLAMATVVSGCSRFASSTDRSMLFVGAVVCVTLICVIFQYSTGTFSRERLTRKQITFRGSLISLTMLAVGVGTWYVSGLVRDNIEGFQEWWVGNISQQISGLGMSEIKYSQNATLENITKLKKSDPLNVVLRVHSDYIPGYLRGNTYSKFQGRRWDNHRRMPAGISASEAPDALDVDEMVFNVLPDPAASRFRKVRVENQDTIVAFAPLQPNYMMASVSSPSNTLTVRSDRTFNNLDTSKEYSAFVGDQVSTERLAPGDEKEFLKRYSRLEREARAMAWNLTADARSDSERIARIEAFFRDNYSYSLDQKKFPQDRDPLSYFVLQKPGAHCEFFASAAVVFLREAGVPSRYVTGFAVQEKSTEEEYYIARNQDAHAWAEAFDRDRQIWVVVEATPGAEFPKSIWANESEEDDGGTGNAAGAAEIGTRFQFSFFIQRIWIQAREFFEELGRQLRGPLNFALTTLVIFGLAYRYWWRPRFDPYLKSRVAKLETERRKVEKILAKFRIVRRKNETMLQFERRAEATLDHEIRDRMQPVFAWLREYELSRFGDSDPEGPIPEAPRMPAT